MKIVLMRYMLNQLQGEVNMQCPDCKKPMVEISKSQYYNAMGEPVVLETPIYKCPECHIEMSEKDD